MTKKPELLVTVYSDYICPFCYIGSVRLDHLRDEYELKVNWRFIEIHPETSAEGQSVDDLGYAPEQWGSMMDNLRNMATEDGIHIGDHKMTTNSHDALLLAEAAKVEGKDIFYELNKNIFEAYFSDGRNIGDRTVLEDIADNSGVRKETVEHAWSENKFEELLKNNLVNAVSLQVSGTPTFFFGENKLTGAVPVSALREAARDATP